MIKEQTDQNKGLLDRRLTKKKFKDSEAQGGCQYFDQSLTNNGLCYSFNALKPSSIWKSSKIINLLEGNAEEDDVDYRYGGTGATRGNISFHL